MVGVFITADVRVLFVSVSVVALPTNVSVDAGSVIVTSEVDTGPIRVALLVPFPDFSKKSMNPALSLPFLTLTPAL